MLYYAAHEAGCTRHVQAGAAIDNENMRINFS